MAKARIEIEKQTYGVRDVSNYLGLSPSGGNNLMHAVDFPSFRVGNRLLVTKAAFEKWLEETQEKAMEERKAAVYNGPWGRSNLGLRRNAR